MSLTSRIATLLVLMPFVAACSGKPDDAPELGLVSGTVTMGGQPVPNAFVNFYPDTSKGTTGPSSSGTTDAGGNFTLTAPGGAEGAVIGSHKVTVVCRGEVSSSDGSAPAVDAGKCEVPAKYSDVRDTDLTAEVQAGDNTVTLDIKG